MISSAQNAIYRRWLHAKEKPDRHTGEILLEGFHLIQAWAERYGHPEGLMVSQEHRPADELRNWLSKHPVPVETLSPGLFGKLSSLENFSGPMALVRPRSRTTLVPDARKGDLVYLERVQDPGNLGTILRSCAAMGVRQVALSPGTVWAWSPKVLRAGMSAHFQLDCFEDFSVDQITQLPGFQLIVTSGQSDPASVPLHQLSLNKPGLWCFGNEGSGLSEGLLNHPGAARTYVPHSGQMESLNVASALAICLYEQQRQRLLNL